MPSQFQLRFARSAELQYTKYRYLRENQSPLQEQIQKYWRDLQFNFPGVSTPWSAVFVSWCALQAGASAHEFPFSARHGDYINTFISNAKNKKGGFMAHRLETYAPKVGDILHNNRSGNSFTYDYAAKHVKYESHSAIVTEVGVDTHGGYLRTVGGNETDAVGIKEVRLNRKGFVHNPQGLYISIVETLL